MNVELEDRIHKNCCYQYAIVMGMQRWEYFHQAQMQNLVYVTMETYIALQLSFFNVIELVTYYNALVQKS